MSTAVLLAFAAAALAPVALWEGLAALEASAPAARLATLAEPLARAGREGRAPTPPEQRRLGLLAAASLLLAGWLLAGPIAGVVAALAGPGVALALVRARRRRFRAGLRAGAPAAARALADALGAGHSVRGGLVRAAEGLDGPVGHELRLTAHLLAVGERTEDALEALRRRAGSRAWDTLVAAVLLQRDAGGDLPRLLRELAETQEATDRLERDARTATAQARLTAWLVVALPLCAAAVAQLVEPGFLPGLLAQPLSATLTGAAVLFELLAVLAIRRLARGRRLA